MKKSTKYIRLVICMSIILNFFVHAPKAYACSCPTPGSPEDEFWQHNAVFTGKVVRIADNYSPLFSSIDYILHQWGYKNSLFRYFDNSKKNNLANLSIFFNVTKSWKGIETTHVEVSTGHGYGDCGYTFLPGEEYLVYANYAYGIPDNYWITGICSRNSILTSDLEDVEYLSTKPTLFLKYSLPIIWTIQDLIFLSVIVFVTLLFAGIIKKRRRKKIAH